MNTCFLKSVLPSFLVACAAVPTHLAARTITVEPADGDNVVKAAVEQSLPGDTITLRPGIYHGGFKIQHELTLQGEPGSQILLASSETIEVDNVTDLVLDSLNVATLNKKSAQPQSPRLLIRNSKRVTVRDCQLTCDAEYGVTCVSSKKVEFIDCHIFGKSRLPGIYINSEQVSVSGCVVRGFESAIHVDDGSGICITGNLFDQNQTGVLVNKGAVNVRENSFMGPGFAGVRVVNGDVNVTGNSARGFTFGIVASSPAKGVVARNNTAGNDFGIGAGSYSIRFSRNTASYNRRAGIFAKVPVIVRPKKGELLEIEGNTISSNGEAGIVVVNTHEVHLGNNLVENNKHGVILERAQAEIVRNTIVLNEETGVTIAPGSYAAIDRNIVANNKFGIRRHQFAVIDSSNNVVFGHIGGQGYALTDSNFSKQDWLPLSDGKEMIVGVVPSPRSCLRHRCQYQSRLRSTWNGLPIAKGQLDCQAIWG